MDFQRKAIAATNKVNISGTIGDNLKNERKTTKRRAEFYFIIKYIQENILINQKCSLKVGSLGVFYFVTYLKMLLHFSLF